MWRCEDKDVLCSVGKKFFLDVFFFGLAHGSDGVFIGRLWMILGVVF